MMVDEFCEKLKNIKTDEPKDNNLLDEVDKLLDKMKDFGNKEIK